MNNVHSFANNHYMEIRKCHRKGMIFEFFISQSDPSPNPHLHSAHSPINVVTNNEIQYTMKDEIDEMMSEVEIYYFWIIFMIPLRKNRKSLRPFSFSFYSHLIL